MGMWIAGVALAVILLVLLFRSGPDGTSRRMDLSRATEADVRRLLTEGHKIQAIKVYRELYGVGLKEAKEAVERIAEGQPPRLL